MTAGTKFCVFCGEAPESKNKEHVIPRWLIEMTGDPKRKAFFGIDHTNPSMPLRSFAFDAFAFPACKRCNTEFGELETSAKAILKKVIGASDLTCREVSVFLDWLDKVRQGFWLAHYYLDKNHLGLKRNHHIKSRTGLYDRAVLLFDRGTRVFVYLFSARRRDSCSRLSHLVL